MPDHKNKDKGNNKFSTHPHIYILYEEIKKFSFVVVVVVVLAFTSSRIHTKFKQPSNIKYELVNTLTHTCDPPGKQNMEICLSK